MIPQTMFPVMNRWVVFAQDDNSGSDVFVKAGSPSGAQVMFVKVAAKLGSPPGVPALDTGAFTAGGKLLIVIDTGAELKGGGGVGGNGGIGELPLGTGGRTGWMFGAGGGGGAGLPGGAGGTGQNANDGSAGTESVLGAAGIDDLSDPDASSQTITPSTLGSSGGVGLNLQVDAEVKNSGTISGGGNGGKGGDILDLGGLEGRVLVTAVAGSALGSQNAVKLNGKTITWSPQGTVVGAVS